MTNQPPPRKQKLHGIRWEPTNIAAVDMKRNTKSVLDSGSLEKFVFGPMRDIVRSCTTEKSSMQFWRSRMLRKKSFDNSLTGLTVGAGAMGGPFGEYSKLLVSAIGGAGCRARKLGMKTPKSSMARGRTERSEGSRHTNV